MTTPPSYRKLAERTLGQAADSANLIPNQGRVNADEVAARSAAVQALATIGDTIREAHER